MRQPRTLRRLLWGGISVRRSGYILLFSPLLSSRRFRVVAGVTWRYIVINGGFLRLLALPVRGNPVAAVVNALPFRLALVPSAQSVAIKNAALHRLADRSHVFRLEIQGDGFDLIVPSGNYAALAGCGRTDHHPGPDSPHVTDAHTSLASYETPLRIVRRVMPQAAPIHPACAHSAASNSVPKLLRASPTFLTACRK